MVARDLPRVARLYRARSRVPPPAGWTARMRALLGDRNAVALVAPGKGDRDIAGCVFAEVRTWEFGSEPAGWIFALAVALGWEERGTGSALLNAAIARLRQRGVRTIRTMVSRDDVDMLRFFRHEGFAAGPYAELEQSPAWESSRD